MLGWELPPHNSGGLGVACYHLSKALAQEGATIDFVLPYQAKHDIDFMQVHAATQLNPLWRSGNGAYSTYCGECDDGNCDHRDLGDLRAIQARYGQFVQGLVKKLRPQVVHAHDWLTIEAGILAKKSENIPLIVHVHATEFDRSGQFYGSPLVHEIEEQGLLMADRIIAVSNVTKNLIIKRYNIPESKIEVVHNTLALSSLGPHAYNTNTYLYLESLRAEGYRVVATLGRLTIQKGMKYFLSAAAKASERYDKLLFLIVGDGEQRDELIQLSCDLGISDKVFFTGFIRGQVWRDAYTVADIFVMSSVSEPFGLTALEAAAHQTAILLSKQSGVGEVLSSVMRFDYWDETRLADEIINVATSEALRGELTRNVAGEYDRISWSEVASQINNVYLAGLRSAA